tara:strand:- start:368 stop:559 length:192 start_codon:yes stop_codon:yes gene_type:complete
MSDVSWTTYAYHMFVSNSMEWITMLMIAIWIFVNTYREHLRQEQLDSMQSKLDEIWDGTHPNG